MKVIDGVVVELRREDDGMCLIARVEPPELEHIEEDNGVLCAEILSWDLSGRHAEWSVAGIKEGTKVRIEIGGE